MEIIKDRRPPTGLGRLLFRLPIHLYRLGLGWLLGDRFLLLTHVGRVSGRTRRTVIEVIEHDPRAGDYVVCSGYGPRADWYRNVLTTPEVTIQVGRHVLPATAVPLGEEEGGETMARYARHHPWTARRLVRVLGFAVDGSPEDYRAVGRHLPFVRLRPRQT
ncbi:deazaflavin-dependent oxidoreductase, nitroreductase family [Amycolatopsis arida]|uniref:Deazaflavin-dependent oxidoreductase, nitroreductase family n=1 Tax=Amycolatopsis arida TaxID=587909 RepID=A0A1I5V938_9PSEU|nr:nitroreductase family deazaflavin-dependent oxidoreductase [Amycolatopsis arida]TDX91194.1 deazaflavin-dependent oxidoreductase (nitroreductase family) [Amycolatopsis arida]SFQ04009.1 deazaflavin-dependent oxidoreductase, nitroreductase family [Amycolatopsis arida]